MHVLHDDVVERRGTGANVDYALEILSAEGLVHVGLAKVAIHHAHTVAVGGVSEREVGCGEGLTFAGDGGGRENHLGVLGVVAETQAGVQGEEGFGDLTVGVVDHDLRLVGLLHLFDLRDDAQQGKTDHRLDVEGTLHPIIDERDKEGEREAETEAADHTDTDIEGDAGFDVTVGGGGHGGIDLASAAVLHRGLHVHLAHTGDELGENLVVDLKFTLLRRILHRKSVQSQGVARSDLELLASFLVVAQSRLVFGLHRGGGGSEGTLKLALGLGQIIGRLNHHRMAVTIALAHLGDLDLASGNLLGELPDVRVFRDEGKLGEVLFRF